MSGGMAQITAESVDNSSGLHGAYEAIDEAMKELDLREHRDQWCELQRRYFDLKAAMLARDPEFQDIDLSGTRLNVPSSHAVVGDNPTAEDELGEVELPTRNEGFRILDGLQVADPENPHITHAVTVDHVIETDGDVRLEVNALPIDQVGVKQGSHIR